MEIFADLNSSGIYLSGDTIKCQLTFLNTHDFDPETVQEKLEHVAWASVQIQCICQVANPMVSSGPSRRESETNAPASLDNPGTAGTSLQPQKDAFTREVFATKPKILFCDLFLEPRESKSFEFEESIPMSGPHSYNGRGMKYAYRVIVASQRLNQSISSLKIPFRVMSVASLNIQDLDHQNPNQNQLNNPSITNPFLIKDTDKDQVGCDKSTSSILSLLQEPSARRLATFYDVKNAKGRVGRLCLFKNSYRLGEEIVGLFDFSEAESQCMQYSVSLYCEEQVKSKEKTAMRIKPKVMIKESSQEFSFGYDESNFTLPIPLHGTPSFSDENCSLEWMLRFEFVIAAASEAESISKQPMLDQDSTEGHEWNGPAHCQVETMTWNLPIKVLPTNPKQVANVVTIQTQYSMAI